MSTEVNWYDMKLYNDKRMYEMWLDKGLCGSLLFDYSGRGLGAARAADRPAGQRRNGPWSLIREASRGAVPGPGRHGGQRDPTAACC